MEKESLQRICQIFLTDFTGRMLPGIPQKEEAVKKIVEEHGGKIWAASEEGVGTTMYLVVRKYQEVPLDE